VSMLPNCFDLPLICFSFPLAIYEQIDITVKEFTWVSKIRVNKNNALFIIKHLSYFSYGRQLGW